MHTSVKEGWHGHRCRRSRQPRRHTRHAVGTPRPSRHVGVRDVRDPKGQELLRAAGANARVASVAEAAAGAAVVLLRTPWANPHHALRSAGALPGKVLIDATNPIVLGPALLEEGLLVDIRHPGPSK